MKKYMITDAVDLKLLRPEEVLSKEIAVAGVPLAAGIPIAIPVVALAVLAAAAMRDKSVTKITTLEQLREYKNCISDEWKEKTLYVEHPHRQKCLIEATLYKDYILREMVADIANYIMDHFDLSKLVIGVVAADKANAKVKVPVEKLNADAELKCNLDKNYTFSVCDTHSSRLDEPEHIWIGQFPDIISAVQHGAEKMEVSKKIALDLNVGVGIWKTGGNVGSKKNNELYISYVGKKR